MQRPFYLVAAQRYLALEKWGKRSFIFRMRNERSEVEVMPDNEGRVGPVFDCVSNELAQLREARKETGNKRADPEHGFYTVLSDVTAYTGKLNGKIRN